MKEKGKDYAKEEEGVDSTPHDPPVRDLTGTGKIKWYQHIPWDKVLPKLPQLRNIRGSKTRINLWMFSEIDHTAQSIFEKNKSFFRFRAQVDILAYYLGARILEELYLTRHGFPKSKLSQMLESMEDEYVIYDEMKILKEKFKADLEKYHEGFISEKQIYEKNVTYVTALSHEKNRDKMAKILDDLIGQESDTRIKNRLRKRRERENDKIHIVKE